MGSSPTKAMLLLLFINYGTEMLHKVIYVVPNQNVEDYGEKRVIHVIGENKLKNTLVICRCSNFRCVGTF